MASRLYLVSSFAVKQGVTLMYARHFDRIGAAREYAALRRTAGFVIRIETKPADRLMYVITRLATHAANGVQVGDRLYAATDVDWKTWIDSKTIVVGPEERAAHTQAYILDNCGIWEGDASLVAMTWEQEETYLYWKRIADQNQGRVPTIGGYAIGDNDHGPEGAD